MRIEYPGTSFHGGGLVTDKPDSPHRLVATIKAQYLIAIAENDDEAQAERAWSRLLALFSTALGQEDPA